MLSKNSLGSEHFKDQNSVHSFLCTVCYSVPHPDIAVELIECGHIFCEECLKELRKSRQTCPNCSRAIGYSYRSLKTGNKIAHRILMDLDVKCTKQCPWSGAWSSLDKHLANCEKLLPCKYADIGCKFKGIAADKKEHEKHKSEYHLTLAESQIEHLRKLLEEKTGPLQPVVEKTPVFVLGNKYKVSVHEHLLTYIKKGGWACNRVSPVGGCKSNFRPGKFVQTKDEPRFKCDDCDYDLCGKCVEAYLIY